MIKKIVIYKINDIVRKELKKEYYENVAHIKEIIDIEKRNVDNEYLHVENLVIWKNGFYNFQKFDITTPVMRSNFSSAKKKVNNIKRR